MSTVNEQLSLYEEYNEMYAKQLKKLMRLSNKAIIEKNCIQFEAAANEYIAKFKAMEAIPLYIDKITGDIRSIKTKF